MSREQLRLPGVPWPLGFARLDPAVLAAVSRRGGQAVSRDREHMAAIGRRGGQAVSRDREHMAAIGRRGGQASRGGARCTS